ncbi:MAG: DNA gyrase inhibitor YacG [Pirellulales bacterium]|nr:DNA gyrase inhibitor YacG [Pirellulales bacterium]
MATAVCPICQRQFEPEVSPARPFCSERCRQIDLGRWLSEAYVVPGSEAEPDESAAKLDPPPQPGEHLANGSAQPAPEEEDQG